MDFLASLQCAAIHRMSHDDALRPLSNLCPENPDDEVPIPSSRNIFESLRSINDPEESYNSTSAGLIPSVAECAVHLELLDAIAVLRQKVMKSSALAQLFWNGKLNKLTTAWVWKFFVELAVIRFAVWFDSLGEVLKSNGQLDLSTLPPIDVLMIWLTFTLNPQSYQEAVKGHSFKALAKVEMPWSAIHQIFSKNSGRFVLPGTASQHFQQVTGLVPDLLCFLLDVQRLSPVEQEFKLTKLQLQQAKVKTEDFYLRFESWDKPQQNQCEMTGDLTEKSSPLSQLLQDTKDSEDGGTERMLTRLRMFGRPWPSSRPNPCALRQSKATREDLTEIICTASRNDRCLRILTFGELRGRLESYVPTFCQLKKLLVLQQSRLTHSIQWLILAYARLYRIPKGLVDSFMRQGSFISLMDHLRILRSPAAFSTLKRAILRYERFMSLIELHPGVILAPTPDIDLVWHTMQACPWRYRHFCSNTMKNPIGVIRHDDGIGEAQIDDGKVRAAELYEIIFREKFQVCLCWDCEALREAVETAPKNDTAKIEMTKMAQRVRKTVKAHRKAEVIRRESLWTMELGRNGS